MSENDNWREMSSEEENSGNRFEGENNYNRPSYNREGGDRPQRPSYGNNNGERPYRPRFNPSAENGERPQRPYNNDRPYNNNDRSYGNDRPYRPHYNNDGQQQQRSYGNNNGGGFRPRYNNNNSDGQQRSYGNNNGGGFRPRYNNNDGQQQRPSYGNDRPQRPRFNANGGGQQRSNYGNNRPQQQRPRFNGAPNQGGFARPQQRRTGDYNPNAKYTKKKQIEYRERYIDPSEPIRLNKYLANAGVCSRREADEFIAAGVVSVNGVVVTELGTKIQRGDEVKFHEQPVSIERKIYILLNKPKDCVTTTDDPHARRTVMDLVKGACEERIYPVGRLDRNTTGVLLLTNDGELSSKLTHPQYLKKKVYLVTLDKNLAVGDMNQIATGIKLDDGEIHADEISYADDVKRNVIGIEIHSGKNRVVRRIFESLGYKVTKLDRVLFAGLTKKGLRRGEWRFLNQQEVNFLNMGSFE
ncbi:MAG: RNA-binding S4 domain-containing protein [Prevotellaceae bacterium]|jgi:23S rRNA pseudouridine2605 synthase|nr:RNA-binding S4 domain-containing protein [Prevotellaceae bacterium]